MKKFYDKYSWLIILLLTVLAISLIVRGCNAEPKVIVVKPSKIQAGLKKTEQAKKEAIATVSINTVYITKWKEVKVNAGKMPCDTALEYVISFCDTIIQKDTLAINSLKKVVLHQDTLISDYQDLVKVKSDSISTLSKKLKWSKLKTKGIIALWVIREAVGVGAKVVR